MKNGGHTSTLLRSFCFLLLPVLTNATITILDSGRRFSSREDPRYGPLFWKGYQYMARLQYIQENISLCPSANNRTQNLQLPADNLPVALLVRSGGCTLREKVDYIKNNIKQSGLINFLIVDGSSYLGDGLDDDDTEDDELDFDDREMAEAMKLGHVKLQSEMVVAGGMETPMVAGDFLGRHRHRDEVTIPYHIVHVGSRTHFQLLEMIVHQTNESYKAGGIRISMDSRTNTMDSSTALWIAFSSLLGACCCSLCLIVNGTRNNWWEEPQPPQQQQHTRPQRRRLNKEQVKRLFPIYQFNGETLEPLEDTPQLVTNHENQDEENNDGLQPFVPRPLELSMCSICLDDFEPGDRLRCLECQHAFCSRCIGKWLVERSATCPLCKMEIYDPEEEEEEEDEEDEEEQGADETGENQEEQDEEAAANNENNGISRVPSSFFRVFNPRSVSLADQEASAEEETEQRVEESSPTPLELADNASTVVVEQQRSWWRRTFRRLFATSSSRESRLENMEGATVSLTQPLLSNNTPDAPFDTLESTMDNSLIGDNTMSSALAAPSTADEEQQQTTPDSEGDTGATEHAQSQQVAV